LSAWHPSDDDLILHFYGEAAADEPRIDAHLGGCHACRQAWQDLRETLTLVDAAATPDPGPGFERIVWARVQQALPARTRLWDRVRRLVPIAALAGLVVAAVTAVHVSRPARSDDRGGAAWSVAGATPTAPAPDATARTRERVLLTALNSHFEQTEVLLVELMNVSIAGRDSFDLSFERDAADDLVFAGRLYRLTAQQHGQAHLVRMLDDLETVLVELARGPEQRSDVELRSLRARIDEASLLFKVRAVSDVVHERQRELMSADD
jgi:hypothetical protein